jgi:hypothetical protein
MDPVRTEDSEVTNVSVSLTEGGLVQRFSYTTDLSEYTGKVEGKGNINVEKPDWIDRDVAPVASVAEESDKLIFKLMPGNLDAVRLEGPNGASAEMDTYGKLIITVEIKEGGFSKEEINGNLVTPNVDECRILGYPAGQTADGADIPCDGSGIEGLDGDDIRYEADADYRFVSGTDGEEAVQDVLTSNVEKEPGESVTFSIDSTSNLTTVYLVAPNGNRSARMNELLVSGVTMEVQEGSFSDDEIEGGLVTPNDDECRILHGEDEVAGQTVDGADIPCDGSGIDNLSGKEIRYQAPGEYQLIGVLRGNSWIIQKVAVREDS